MTDNLHNLHELHELHERTTADETITLLWRATDDRVFVAVTDKDSGESLRLEVHEGERALDVFHHPYAYAAWHGLAA